MSDFAPVQRTDWLAVPEGLTRIEGGSVTSPEGFTAAGVACGIKRSGDLDVGVLRSTRPATSWLVDTINALPSAPVRLNRSRDRTGLTAVVVNAGCANADTGAAGLDDARATAARVGELLGIPAERVAVGSTGTIGERLPMDTLRAGVAEACGALSRDGGDAFNRAPKGGAFRMELPGGTVTIGIAAKGAGMIRPTMATMLAYLTTDAALTAADVRAVTERAARESFNRISVDGQMSPSDTLLVMANGEGAPLDGDDLAGFADAVVTVCRWAAVQMVKDGEGAEHAVRVMVSGARDVAEAERVARAVGESSLVKCAVFGRDPNWGRISQAVGQCLARTPGVPVDLGVRIDGVALDDPGIGEVMTRAEYDIQVSLGRGVAAFDLWVSDLTHAYVTLNAEYHT